MKNDTTPFLVERLPRKNFDFFFLVSLFNVSRFHLSIGFSDCDVCHLFYRENLASPYKCSKVESICSACIKRKRFVTLRSILALM